MAIEIEVPNLAALLCRFLFDQLYPNETTLGENTKDPTTCRDSEKIGVEKLGQRPKMSSNGEPLGAGLHCIYTTLHEGYTRLSMRLHTVQCYASDVIVELRLCGMTSREAACTA